MILFLAAAKTFINFVNKVKVKIFCCKPAIIHSVDTSFRIIAIRIPQFREIAIPHFR